MKVTIYDRSRSALRLQSKRMRTLYVASIVTLVTLASTSTSVAISQGGSPSRTQFRAETTDKLVPTAVGVWADSASDAHFGFSAGHIGVGETRFVATWRPKIASPSRNPSLKGTYTAVGSMSAQGLKKLIMGFRFRVGHLEWDPWTEMDLRFFEGDPQRSAGFELTPTLLRKKPIQFQWRLRGRLSSGMHVSGSADLQVTK